MTSLDRITIDPDRCNGKPKIRGTRLTVQTVLELLRAGEDRAEILRQYPFLAPEDIDARLDFREGQIPPKKKNPRAGQGLGNGLAAG